MTTPGLSVESLPAIDGAGGVGAFVTPSNTAFSELEFSRAIGGTRRALIGAIKEHGVEPAIFRNYTAIRVNTGPLKEYLNNLGQLEDVLGAVVEPLLTFAEKLHREEHAFGMYVKALSLTSLTQGQSAGAMDLWLNIWESIGRVYPDEPEFLGLMADLHSNHGPAEIDIGTVLGYQPENREVFLQNLAARVIAARSLDQVIPTAA